MSSPRFIPWSHIKSWSCDACGECCRWFSIPLTLHEYAKISRLYGQSVISLRLGKAYLRKKSDGRCIFQFRKGERWLCGLQAEKPYACRMWPFSILRRPSHGGAEAALWEGTYERTYVYVDPRCPKTDFGAPTRNLLEKVLPEFVDVRFGEGKPQQHTTCALPTRTYQKLVLLQG